MPYISIVLLPAVVTLAIHLLLLAAEIVGWISATVSLKTVVWMTITAVCSVYIALKTYSNYGGDDITEGNPRESLGGCAFGLIIVGLIVGLAGESISFLRHPIVIVVLYGTYAVFQFVTWPVLGKALLVYALSTGILHMIVVNIAVFIGLTPAGFKQLYWIAMIPMTFILGAWVGMIAAALFMGRIDRKKMKEAEVIEGMLAVIDSLKPPEQMSPEVRAMLDTQSTPECSNCGTVYNRKAVERELRAQSPYMFESPVWTTRFTCVTCRKEIWISGKGNG